MTTHQPPTRVLLWAPPRSLSTVLEKCLSYVDGVQIIHEPFLCASQCGPERKTGANEVAKGFQQIFDRSKQEASATGSVIGWDDSMCTFQWVKDTLEADYPGKKVIFCKDLVSGITGKFHMIPRGYRHTFLIRNPTKVIFSLRKLILKALPPSVPAEKFRLDMMKSGDFDTSKFFLGDLLELRDYLKEQSLEADPIIIDADDLQNHPESILRQYCQAVSIQYNENLMKWEAGDDIVGKNWLTSRSLLEGNKTYSCYGAAFASTGFLPATDPPSTDELTPDVVALAEKAEPYYKELYEHRLKP